MARVIASHLDACYAERVMRSGEDRWNGAWYYSEEILRGIVPKVRTDRPWVLVNYVGMCEDRAIVFAHHNLNPRIYSWLSAYRDLVIVACRQRTADALSHLGRTVVLPLSVDVAEVASHARPKDRDVCYAGRRSKMPAGLPPCDVLSGMPRDALLDEMARYRRVYAIDRTAIEAHVLGCEVLPYDPEFPDPSVWAPLDTADAAAMLQGMLDGMDD